MNGQWTSLASVLGAVAFLQTLVQTVFPPELRFAAVKLFLRLCNWFSTYCYFDVTEIDGVSTNELYNAVQLYLSNSPSITSGRRVSLTRAVNSSAFTYGLSSNDRLVDSFRGATAVWEHVIAQRPGPQSLISWRPLPDERRSFSLRIRKKDRDLIIASYLDHIMESAAEIRRRNQDRLLYTNSRGGGVSVEARGYPWESVPFKHPSTFDTLAMDPARKAEIMADLRSFVDGRAFYETTGRAWKRGYLLYGPPGTGKSSMIAAMANYLGYDIYDLELTEVRSNSDLRKLLMRTTSKSIIVIEDIDCSINLATRSCSKPMEKASSPLNGPPPAATDVMADECGGGNTITLSGLLNFTDGLWSCCGSERIFIFTTNHIDKLDPALLRSGRMDMHIHMTHCTFPALKILLKNYLGVDDEEADRSMMEQMEEVIDSAAMTPADISEVLIRNRRMGIDKSISELLCTLKERAGARPATNDWTAPLPQPPPLLEVEEQEKRALEMNTEDQDTVSGFGRNSGRNALGNKEDGKED